MHVCVVAVDLLQAELVLESKHSQLEVADSLEAWDHFGGLAGHPAGGWGDPQQPAKMIERKQAQEDQKH